MTLIPHFNFIREQIIKELYIAEKKICVAVCWFTNEELFNILCNKLDEGLVVEIIILDDYINSNPYGCEFEKFIKKGGHLYTSNTVNPMHNKYCIIDDITLINGSYNWTYFAETKNSENIIIFKGCSELVISFQNDFNRLKLTTTKVELYKKKSLLDFNSTDNEIKSRNTFGAFNFLSHDLFLKAMETQNKEYYEIAKKIVPDNIEFQKVGIKLNWDKSIILKSTLSSSLAKDNISIIFPAGTIIPAEQILNYTTAINNQKDIGWHLLKGEDTKASKNQKIKYFLTKNIPQKPAGEVSIEEKYQILLDGKLYITSEVQNIGLVEKQIVDLNLFECFNNK